MEHRLLIFLSFLFCVTVPSDVSALTPDEFFELKIRPTLMGTCFKCHGGEKVSNGLRLDTREHLMKGGERGPAINPGNPESSFLLQAIRRDHKEFSMPPKKALPLAVANDFQTWIEAGAHWPTHLKIDSLSGAGRHWSFQPIRKIVPPIVANALSQHPIDQFVRARQKEMGLRPVNLADRRALIRRVSFDLTGLPPTPEQVKAFIADDRPKAYSELVDEALASPRYGERWGRRWLDLARYADTAGENSDYPIPEARLYRDYVIDSFNQDKPYNQFVQEQIAGDILARNGAPEDYAQRVIATGFLAQAKRFGTGDLEDMHLIIEDTLHTMGEVVLGLGLRCARCHDHKYDPTTTEDYYALYGFFESTAYPFPGGESARVPKYFSPTIHPEILLPKDAAYSAKYHSENIRLKAALETAKKESPEALRVAALIKDIAALKVELDACTDDVAKSLQDKIAAKTGDHKKAKKGLDQVVKAVQTELDKIKSASPSGRAPLAYAVSDGKPANAFVQKGGNPQNKGDEIQRGVPAFLRPNRPLDIPKDGSGRVQLAQWLTDPDNPLTARVMVNRIWQFHFGRPIVSTPSDFGIQGDSPTHPDLLDWLAAQFIESGWSIKAMHRLIMSSKTYQLASGHNADNEVIDSGNVFYWRFDRRRLNAESIRDSMLMLGKNLDLNRPGAHPFPPVNKWGFSAHRQFKAVYESNHRSVYLMVQRLHPHPFLSVFNGPDTSASTATRDEAVTPMQALFMSNSDLVEKQARGLATWLIDAEIDAPKRIELAYWHAFSRAPEDREMEQAVTFLNRYADLLKEERIPRDQWELESWSSYARTLLTANEFVFVD